jgi:CBS domain-containing protein
MRCETIMSRDVQWVEPHDSVERAARLMAFHNLGLLPVCRANGRAVGVLTDRDIALRVAGENRSASLTTVHEVMTKPVAFVGPDCPLDRVAELMTLEGRSRLLVLGDQGQLEGVVSLADLLAHGPGRRALQAARGIYARETPDRSSGAPHPASEPTPQYFHGGHDATPSTDAAPEQAARAEADTVIRGGVSGFKEFPG